MGTLRKVFHNRLVVGVRNELPEKVVGADTIRMLKRYFWTVSLIGKLSRPIGKWD